MPFLGKFASEVYPAGRSVKAKHFLAHRLAHHIRQSAALGELRQRLILKTAATRARRAPEAG